MSLCFGLNADSESSVLPHLLPAHRHWKRLDQPVRCQLPGRIQGIRPWNSHQHLPEAHQVCLSWTCCYLWWHDSCSRQGWFDSWKASVSKVLTLLSTLARCPHQSSQCRQQTLACPSSIPLCRPFSIAKQPTSSLLHGSLSKLRPSFAIHL